MYSRILSCWMGQFINFHNFHFSQVHHVAGTAQNMLMNMSVESPFYLFSLALLKVWSHGLDFTSIYQIKCKTNLFSFCICIMVSLSKLVYSLWWSLSFNNLGSRNISLVRPLKIDCMFCINGLVQIARPEWVKETHTNFPSKLLRFLTLYGWISPI